MGSWNRGTIGSEILCRQKQKVVLENLTQKFAKGIFCVFWAESKQAQKIES